MKKVTLTIVALVTEDGYEDIDYIIRDSASEKLGQTDGKTALRIADKLDNKYAEIIHADAVAETVTL